MVRSPSPTHPLPLRRLLTFPRHPAAPQKSADELEARISEAMGAEIEAAVAAVHEAMEAELDAMQGSVSEAVSVAMQDERMSFDVVANFNTLVALTGVVIFERGVWTAVDVYCGDGPLSVAGSIAVGAAVMAAIRVFNIPLAEWRRPSLGD